MQWDSHSENETIDVKELIPIVIAAAVWDRHWASLTVQCRCENMAVVYILTSRTSRNKATMHLLRCLFFIEASFECRITATHIPGVHHDLADDLSRDRRSSFLHNLPTAHYTPQIIPQELVDLLCRTGDLDEHVHHLFEQGLAASTRRSYHSGAKNFLE